MSGCAGCDERAKLIKGAARDLLAGHLAQFNEKRRAMFKSAGVDFRRLANTTFLQVVPEEKLTNPQQLPTNTEKPKE